MLDTPPRLSRSAPAEAVAHAEDSCLRAVSTFVLCLVLFVLLMLAATYYDSAATSAARTDSSGSGDGNAAGSFAQGNGALSASRQILNTSLTVPFN